MYVHYYHEQKCSRKINNVSIIQKSSVMKDEIMRVLEEQNLITFDVVESTLDNNVLFVESDIQSELVFDSNNENIMFDDVSSLSTIHLEPSLEKALVQTPIRHDQEAFGSKRKRLTKSSQRKTIFDTLKGRRRKKTLLQKMERIRRGRDRE